MSNLKNALVGILPLFIALTLGSKCSQDSISKSVVCYYKGETSIINLNVCNCTHIIFTNALKKTDNSSLELTEDAKKSLAIIEDKKSELIKLFTLETKPEDSSKILKSENRSQSLIRGILDILEETQFSGVELNFKFSPQDGVSKESYSSFVKTLSKTLSSKHHRVKREKREGYDVVEKVQDDVTTAAYSTQAPKNSTSKTQSIKQEHTKDKKTNRKTRENKEYEEESTTLEMNKELMEEENTSNENSTGVLSQVFYVFVRLSIKPEIIAKKYDLKTISRYAHLLMVPTHNIFDKNEENLTYHPSRLVGLSDVLNTDSILDLLTGMGAIKTKIVISLPATALKFQLKDEKKNIPRSPATASPQVIDQSQLCSLFSKSNWTLERDDDLTGPYAFSGKNWLAFEDKTSVEIKGKYILLRDLAGGAVYPIDADVNDRSCTNSTGTGGFLTRVLYQNFRSLERKPRALVLESLQEEIHDTSFNSIEAGVKLSEYRIVRVVDHSGAVHVIRKNTKTQFECSRQGYFSHPLGCNKFYRCVKFDQYLDEFTVFEYDCPAGLAFDERWEVCVWPGSLPHGAPCTGSSEIAPVPRSHYQCPDQEGYYADPENCRWFFACLDHARDGVTPLTAYEFRCPFGLVFDEARLACDWPWLVGGCGNRGGVGYIKTAAGGASSEVFTASFVNGGNLEASFGQYGNLQEEASFINFGKGFGSVLRQGSDSSKAQESFQRAHKAGFGYIAGQSDESNNNRASFGSLPDYEISGGRILNKGGVVLNDNLNLVGSFGPAFGGAEAGRGIKNGQNFIKLSYQQNLPFTERGDFRKQSENSNLQNTNNGAFQFEDKKLEPLVVQNSAILSKEGRIPFFNPISTPKPFALKNSFVKVNKEEDTSFLKQAVLDTTTSRNLVKNKAIGNDFIQEGLRIQLGGGEVSSGGNQQSVSSAYSVTPSTVQFGVSVVTPKSNIAASEQIVPEKTFGASFNTPTVSYALQSTTSHPEINKLDKSTFYQKNFPAKVSVSQPIAPQVQSSGYASAGQDLRISSEIGGKTVSVAVPTVVAKPEVQSFQYATNSGGVFFGQPAASIFSSKNTIVTSKTSNIFGHEQGDAGSIYGFTGTSFTVPSTTPAAQTEIFRNTIFKQDSIFSSQPSVSGRISDSSSKQPLHTFYNSNAGATRTATGSGLSVSSVTPKPILSGFRQTTIDREIAREISFNTPTTLFGISPTSNTLGNRSPASPTSDQPVQTGFSAVTQETDIHTTFSDNLEEKPFREEISVFKSTYGVPAISSNVQANIHQHRNEQSNTGLKSFPSLSVTVPVVPSSIAKSFEESLSQQNLKQEKFSTKYVNTLPHFTPKSETDDFIQKTSGIGLSEAQPVQPIQQNFRPQNSYTTIHKQTDQRLSSIKPFEASDQGQRGYGTRKDASDNSRIVTHVSVEPQPVVSIGTVNSLNYDQSVSTPQSVTPTVFTPKLPTFSHSKPTYLKPDSPAVTTPVSVLSVTDTPSNSVRGDGYQPTLQLLGSKIFSALPKKAAAETQQINLESVRAEIGSPVSVTQHTLLDYPRRITFGQKLTNIHQNGNKYFPEAEESTPSSLNNQQESKFTNKLKTTYHEANNAFLPAIATRTEIFDSKNQQFVTPSTTLEESFKNIQTERIRLQQSVQPSIDHSFGLLKTKPTIQETQQRIEEIEFKVPLQESTTSGFRKATPQQPTSFTSSPFAFQQEKLEVSKSFEPNPSKIFESTKQINYSPQPTTPVSIQIQKQPVTLFSQKTFSQKLNQPFTQQQSFSSESNHFLQTHQNSFSGPESSIRAKFQQEFVKNSDTSVYGEKQLLSSVGTQTTYLPPESFGSPKAKFVNQPVLISASSRNTYPTEENSRVLFTGHKTRIVDSSNVGVSTASETPKPIKTVFLGGLDNAQHQVTTKQYYEPKANILFPVATGSGQSEYSDAKDIGHQQHENVDFQNVNGVKEIQNIFIQPKTYSNFNSRAFEISGQLLKHNGTQNFVSEAGHSLFGSGVKYSINPNIEIPQPPKEYLLSQNIYPVRRPVLSIKNKDAGYLPPEDLTSKRPSSKATIISVGNVDNHELHEGNIQELLTKYSGKYGEVINNQNGKFVTQIVKENGKGNLELGGEGSSTVRYEVSSATSKQPNRGRQYHGSLTSGIPATNKYEEYEIEKEGHRSINFRKDDNSDSYKTTLDLKNLKLDKNKKTVIVVSQVSDANPILVGKLAGQCSCQSNLLEIKKKGKKTNNLGQRNEASPRPVIVNEYLPPFEDGQGGIQVLETATQVTPTAGESTPKTQLFNNGNTPNTGISYQTEQSIVSSTTASYNDESSPSTPDDTALLITPKISFTGKKSRNGKNQFRGRARYLPPDSSYGGSSGPLLSPVRASEIASTVDYGILAGDESKTQSRIEGENPRVLAGAAFDRYGPGGWRSFDETLQGSVDCKRPGLFRHPKYCNKFYACNYDPWKERYTLHVFNCPVQLTYDSSISACNWPIRGPACADDNLLL